MIISILITTIKNFDYFDWRATDDLNHHDHDDYHDDNDDDHDDEEKVVIILAGVPPGWGGRAPSKQGRSPHCESIYTKNFFFS